MLDNPSMIQSRTISFCHLKNSDTAKQIGLYSSGNIPIIDASGEAASVYVQFIE